MLDDKVKCKGVPRNAELINEDMAIRVFKYHSIIKTRSYLKNENGIYDKVMIKTIKPNFKRQMGFNMFLDPIELNGNDIILKKIDNEGKVNYILDKLKLNNIKVIV